MGRSLLLLFLFAIGQHGGGQKHGKSISSWNFGNYYGKEKV